MHCISVYIKPTNFTKNVLFADDYQTPISPASRVMALNIVSDLIRKVGVSMNIN